MSDKPIRREIMSVLLVGIAGGLITFVYQSLAARYDRAAELREARREAATSLFGLLGPALDTRYYLLMQLTRTNLSEPERALIQTRYDSATFDWHSRLSTNVALACHYFGANRATELRDASQALSNLSALVRQQKNPMPAAEQARRKIFLFELHLADQLRQGDIFVQNVQATNCGGLEPAA